MTMSNAPFEAELRELRAASLDDALLTRLDAVADGNWTQLSAAEQRFEDALRGQRPAPLPAGLLQDFETLTAGVPFAINEKIVLFPKGGSRTNRSQRSTWAAAAAVALIGAATALLIPTTGNNKRTVASAPPSRASQAAPLAASNNLVPASFNRGVSEVHDEGVVWKAGNHPHSVVRVVYKDRITLKDENGRTFEVEQPRVEYMMVPAKAD